ncbi:tRNA (adenosine(37)-N6)-threonylcarbamoyltransferase complex dimerization subunit type 1 TsaB [Corticibacter populi]|uniref:tRNA (Adenosine(37)-N6)-threonylcarbamoyltransferase complex dimerization subunit type 1 TsaB n=1 Tax=Corticibacter populi TaxID=1550736 RepID=A0A3M6QI29_9BURK|nr:tRNA (adenosine(37)-N6)-threonylcarbamoyltransferase complex dimerization subunit type 1 TsaB [Corticibacter populi]RMX02595.1 tRNA (adenosine(37)-N6)-threonylcarbamoyltransferase complex dimerization subunit type 1 TsaB [Corticibacter populi]RZS32992.1 tRNA threonylcarbamoyladenosine biosynthesis protein TsaB [Corticibacter populi]
MKLLALDTSTERLSIALQSGERLWQYEGAGGPQSSQQALPAILELLRQAQLALTALDAIVYGCGPGSFTGLRTSCAVAQGLAWGSGLPAVPVESLLAVAEQARRQYGAEQVMAVLDARMQEVYAAPYRWQPDEGAPDGGTWQREAAIAVLPPAQLQVPPGHALAGNAFEVYPEAFTGQPWLPALPAAEAMLRLAPALMAQGRSQEAQDIAPLYVRDKVAQTTEERARARAAAGRP